MFEITLYNPVPATKFSRATGRSSAPVTRNNEGGSVLYKSLRQERDTCIWLRDGRNTGGDHCSWAASSAWDSFLVTLWWDFMAAFTELQQRRADYAPGLHW